MNSLLIKTAGIVCLTASLFSCKHKDEVKLKTLDDSASYILGFQSAGMWAQKGIDSINAEAFNAGFKAFNPDEQAYPLALDQEKYMQLMQRYSKQLEDKYLAKFKPNIEAGENFLNKNKERKGVITTASGLQYEIIQEGNGPKPSLYDTVTVSYKGTLVDGTVFDSTVDSNPAKFQLQPGYLIQGWIEAFPLLKQGTKAKLYIPYDLAYGEGGNQAIQPYSTLIFEIQLLNVTKGVQPKAEEQNPASQIK
jgi:FKBP-type peptidyl-prolyl cis-trans isomerase